MKTNQNKPYYLGNYLLLELSTVIVELFETNVGTIHCLFFFFNFKENLLIENSNLC